MDRVVSELVKKKLKRSTPMTGLCAQTIETVDGEVTHPLPPRLTESRLKKLIQGVALFERNPKTYKVIAPYTGLPFAEVPLAQPQDVAQARKVALLAQKDWASRSFRERKKVFLTVHDLILGRQDEILDIIQLENGKARIFALDEVLDTAIIIRHYSYHGESVLKARRRRGAIPGLTTTWEYHHPLGVVGFISPWNYPLSLAISDAIPAILAGNAVILKPDQQTPFSALWSAELFAQAGLPPGVFQVLTGRGRDLGQPIIDNAEYVGFTGSTNTGRTIGSQAGCALIGCSLELGGKNPMIVLDDADIGRTVEGSIHACFASTGQLCVSIERMYVQSNLYEQFKKRFIERVNQMRIGPSYDFDRDVGSMSSQAQLAKMREHVDDAVHKGAEVLTGGKDRPDLGPYFYEPTVLENVNSDMAVYAEETFGPLVSLYRFDTIDDVVERANDTPYGLNASVWTRDLSLGQKIATRIQAGTVNINEGWVASWASVDAPMGGYKASGLGRRHGDTGILKYTQPQTVSVQHLTQIGASPRIPNPKYAEIMPRVMKVLRYLPGLR